MNKTETQLKTLYYTFVLLGKNIEKNGNRKLYFTLVLDKFDEFLS